MLYHLCDIVKWQLTAITAEKCSAISDHLAQYYIITINKKTSIINPKQTELTSTGNSDRTCEMLGAATNRESKLVQFLCKKPCKK